MAWALLTRIQQSITDLLKSTVPAVLISGQDPAADPAAVNAAIVDADGNIRVGSTGGALATEATLTTRATEATLATRASEATAAIIKTATEKVATEVGVGTGLLVRQPTATSFKAANEAYLPVAGAAPTQVVGTIANIPEAKSTTMDVGETMTFTPLVDGVRVITATGAARLLSVVGRDIYVTVIAAATTDVQVIADWAANAAATALATPTGTGGTFAAGYAGETLSLWTARTVGTGTAMVLRSDGTYGPAEADALTGATKVYQRGVNTAVDAQQTMPVVAPPKGVNGPAPLLSSAALVEVAGAYDIDFPVSNYDEITVAVYIDAAAGDTYQIDLYGRIDDQAAGDWHLINGQFTATGATALGAAADPCALIASTTNLRMFRELRVRRTKVNNNGNAVARIWIMVGR